MSETGRILNLLARAYEGPAWHGPSVCEALKDVDAARAARRPIAGAHTIAEIVEHVIAWEDITRRRMEGETVEPTPAMDWPGPGAGEAAWAGARTALERGNLALREAIRRFPDARLDDKAGSGITWYVMLHGIVQHDLYHAGQIALLKKD